MEGPLLANIDNLPLMAYCFETVVTGVYINFVPYMPSIECKEACFSSKKDHCADW